MLALLLVLTTLTLHLLLCHTPNALRTYDLDEGEQSKFKQGGERYRYRNAGDDDSSQSQAGPGRRRGRGQVEDDNSNPVFPPRTDAFWEVERPLRGHAVQQSKRVVDKDSQSQVQSASTSQLYNESKGPRPNIILILTDDQDVELGSMEYMPETLKIFRENGIEFRHGYVTTPMCCPSRSSMLTGLYVHNHQVYTNNDNCSSVFWRETFEHKTFAAHLQASGYYTSYIGKYLNKYDGSHIPLGWDDWNALLMNSRFYNYTVNRNGVNVRYGHNYNRDYYPDSIANDTVKFLQRMANPATDLEDEEVLHAEDDDDEGEGSGEISIQPPLPKSRKPDQPFLLVVSFPSPHGPEDSAPQYSHLFLNETSHHTPAYNFAPNRDKQWILQVTPKMDSNLKSFTNLLMAKRLQTLQSVDASVKRIMETLKSTGFEESTYVIYTSDHGYHVGQFGLIKGKAMPYEFDIRVPFFVKVPNKATQGQSTLILEPVLNIDLAPTFLDLARLPIPSQMDGRSFLPLLTKYSNTDSSDSPNTAAWTRTFLIESSGRRDSPSATLPTTTFPPITTKSLLDEDRAQVSELCDLYSHPCHRGQKKYCRKEGDRVRFRKCRNGIDFLVDNPNCQCSNKARSKRQVEPSAGLDWETERQKIDIEIEALKRRIDELREKKRLMKQHFVMTSPPPPVSKVTLLESADVATSSLENESGVKKKNEIHISIFPPSTFRKPQPSPEIETADLEEDDGILEEEEDLFVTPGTLHFEEDEEEEMISRVTPVPVFSSNVTKSRKGGGGLGLAHKNFSSSVQESPDCECARFSARTLRQQERIERRKKKLISKLRKKQRFLNRIQDPSEREQASTCGDEDKMNCFWHDKQHWRTAPLWDGDSFCFCMNSHNNTFSCIRSINSTHNYLYCQFITGFKMYFDLGRDPFQLRNAAGNLPRAEEDWILETLLRLKKCQGSVDCDNERPSTNYLTAATTDNSFFTSVITGENDEMLEPSIWEKVFGTRFRRRKVRDRRQKKIPVA